MKGALAQYSSSTPLKVIQRLRVSAYRKELMEEWQKWHP